MVRETDHRNWPQTRRPPRFHFAQKEKQKTQGGQTVATGFLKTISEGSLGKVEVRETKASDDWFDAIKAISLKRQNGSKFRQAAGTPSNDPRGALQGHSTSVIFNRWPALTSDFVVVLPLGQRISRVSIFSTVPIPIWSRLEFWLDRPAVPFS